MTLKSITALLASCLIASPAGHAARKPNIILILCDDLGYGDVGVFYQNERAAMNDPAVPFFTTPNLDAMARGGAQMTQHYAAAPVCAPSRASLLTGLTQGHANIRDNQFDKALADTHTLGTVLRQAGYSTAAIGKWGLQGAGGKSSAHPDKWPAYPTKRGFDFYYGYVRHMDGHFHYPKEDKRQVWENNREVSKDLDLCYTTDLFTARAKQWIVDETRARPEKPFFLFLAYDTPHAILQNPPCAYPAGGGLNGGLQWTGKPGSMINTATGKKDAWMHPDFENATSRRNGRTAPWPDVQKRYANGVRRIDDAVGDILRLLADLRISNNTLVVFTSDNGPSKESYLKENFDPNFFHGFGPFDGIKRDTLEGGLREPTIARWPDRISPGTLDDHPSGQWNWLATFADVAGVPAPAASDGVSLLPSLTGTGKQAPGVLYVEYVNNAKTPNYPEFHPQHRGRKRGQMQVVFVNGLKGIRYDISSADDDFEIYNLKKDPKESNNLARNPEFKGLQEMMKARALQARLPDANAPRPYDSAPVPPAATPPASPGISWSLFKGAWPWMPDFRTMTPDSTGTSSAIDLSMNPGDAPFGISFEGSFQAPADGEYSFSIDSGGGDAMFFLHDIRLIGETPSSGSLRLKAGNHPFRLLFRHAAGTPKLSISGTLPGGAPLDLTKALNR